MECKILISVIVPVYNTEKYLHTCISSILSQSYSNLELIIINDGSTDNSLEIISNYQADKRVKIISTYNQGVSNARNIGISSSSGDFLMFIDSDDYIESQTLEYLVNHIKINSCDLLFFCWNKINDIGIFKVSELENNSSRLINNDIIWLKKRSIGPTNIQLKHSIKLDIFNAIKGKLYNSITLKDSKVVFKPRNIVGMEDVLFNIEFFQHLNSITFINKYLYNYRVDSENSLTKTDVDKLDNKLKNLILEIKRNTHEDNLEELLNNRIKFSVINILISLTSRHRKINFNSKYRSVKKFLNDSFYHNSFRADFSMAVFKIKIIFILCKYRQAFFLTLIFSLWNAIKKNLL
jgi:glycosyltransferase involved in cell wall biosynthesis